MVGVGCIFLFLSKVKKMSDEDLHRALSVMADDKTAARAAAKSAAKFAGKAAYDNRE